MTFSYFSDRANDIPNAIKIPPVILSNHFLNLKFSLILWDNFEAKNARIKHQTVPVKIKVSPRIKNGSAGV